MLFNSGLFLLVGCPVGLEQHGLAKGKAINSPARLSNLFSLFETANKKHVRSTSAGMVVRAPHMLFSFCVCRVSQRFICCKICAISALE